MTTLIVYDLDLGSGGALLIPGSNLLVGIGKRATMYLVDTNDMGHFNPIDNSQLVQSFFISNGDLRGGPVYWSSPIGELVYVSTAFTKPIKAFQLTGGIFQPTSPVSQSVINTGVAGGWMSLSSNGRTPGTGILWVSEFPGSLTAGKLHALNAENLARDLELRDECFKGQCGARSKILSTNDSKR